MNGPVVVEYEVKQLLDDIKSAVNDVATKLDTKADASLVQELLTRVAVLESWRNRVLGAAAVVVVLGVATVARLLGVG